MEETRASVWLTAIGVGGLALGGLMWFAGSGAPEGSGLEPMFLGFGRLLFGLGVPLFFIGLLVEFFSIGTSLRSIARSSRESASLLKDGHAADAPAPAAGKA